MKWTEEEIKLLKIVYPLGSKEEICSTFPNRKYNLIRGKAISLGYKKLVNCNENSNLKYLLNNTNETFYWLGFFLADGSLHKNTISFSTNHDKDHLQKIANLLNCNMVTSKRKVKQKQIGNQVFYGSETEYSIAGSSRYYTPIIVDKFGLKPRKTYNPPDTSKWNFTNEQLISMFIGFIDGDGHVNFDPKSRHSTIMISLHKSWIVILKYFHKLISSNIEDYIPEPIVDNKKKAFWGIYRTDIIVFLKNFIINNDLPAMSRKWDSVNENFISAKTVGKINQKTIIDLHKGGKSYTEISKDLNLSYKYVFEICSKQKAIEKFGIQPTIRNVEERHNKIIELYNSKKYTVDEIVVLTNTSSSTVASVMKKYKKSIT